MTSAATISRYPYTVHWEEDPDRTRLVTALCRRCEKAMTPWDRKNEPQGIISPSGLEHHVQHDGTLCGITATGEAWWWPL